MTAQSRIAWVLGRLSTSTTVTSKSCVEGNAHHPWLKQRCFKLRDISVGLIDEWIVTQVCEPIGRILRKQPQRIPVIRDTGIEIQRAIARYRSGVEGMIDVRVGEWSIPGATRPGKWDQRRLVAADASVRSHYVAVD